MLVISHIAYELKVINLSKLSDFNNKIVLQEKDNELNDLTVSSKSLRPENVEIFKKAFLGDDFWGRKAVLLNDSDLVFYRKIDTVFTPKANDQVDSLEVKKRKASPKKKVLFFRENFVATSRAPLRVDLPLLGYSISVDLIRLIQITEDDITYNSLLGYFFFKPYITNKKRIKSNIVDNRLKVYYNSSMHFLRSLYDKKLNANGYVVMNHELFQPDSVINYIGRDKACVVGQKDATYSIYFVKHRNGRPKDLNGSKIISTLNGDIHSATILDYLDTKESSQIMFVSDSCRFRKNGTCGDNNIVFKGKMSEKKVGNMLPDDYYPDEIVH